MSPGAPCGISRLVCAARRSTRICAPRTADGTLMSESWNTVPYTRTSADEGLGPGDYPEREYGQRRHRFRRFREKIRRRKRDALHPLGEERRARPHQLDLRAEPEHRGAQAVAAARRPRCVHEPRGLAHLERLLRL